MYDFLPPKTYLIKAIWDQNDNGKWDTGNLIKRIQAEKVVYYIEAIKWYRKASDKGYFASQKNLINLYKNK